MQRLVSGARAVERALVKGDVVRLVVLGKRQVRQADVRDASAAREGEVRFEGLGIEGHGSGAAAMPSHNVASVARPNFPRPSLRSGTGDAPAQAASSASVAAASCASSTSPRKASVRW